MTELYEKEALKKDVLASLHVAVPGHVLSWNPGAQTADIRPMGDLPVLREVPVFLPPGCAGEISPGDGCLVIFADRCADAWLGAGDNVPRCHSLSDGFALVGFRRQSTPEGGEAA